MSRAATPALVVDLRGNEGGDDVGNVMLARLTARPLRLDGSSRLVRYRRIPDDLASCLDTWDPSFKDWGDAAKPFDDRFFRLTRHDDHEDGDRIKPRAPYCEGRVFVLISATNSSATFDFARTVMRSRLASLVGQPTGGNLRGIKRRRFLFPAPAQFQDRARLAVDRLFCRGGVAAGPGRRPRCAGRAHGA